MQAIVVRAHGDPEVLRPEELVTPEPSAAQALVQVEVAGINFRDVLERRGVVDGGPTPPYTPGTEGSGRIVAIGSDVRGLRVGDRVAWLSVANSYADHVIAQADRLVPTPDAIPDETAGAALLQGVTAQYLTTSCRPIEPGDRVLVHAGGGGVGGMLIQFVVALGGHVLSTAARPDKQARARSLGAEVVCDYSDVAEAAMAFTAGRGLDVVFDGVGARTIETGLRSLRPRGTFVLVGVSGGPVTSIPVATIARSALYVTRPSLRFYTATRQQLLDRSSDVFGRIAGGSLRVDVPATYSLDVAHLAHSDLEGRRILGKAILRPGS